MVVRTEKGVTWEERTSLLPVFPMVALYGAERWLSVSSKSISNIMFMRVRTCGNSVLFCFRSAVSQQSVSSTAARSLFTFPVQLFKFFKKSGSLPP